MYIIELITKLILKRKKRSIIPAEENTIEKCSHIFLPVDSSGDFLACNKCGFLIENKKSKTNFFKKNIKK